ncbi:MAG: response regulator [Saprospiraceae bacterium]
MESSELRILIVEDDPIIATDIKLLLRKERFLVVGHAKNAIRAYDLLVSTNPNFIILDIHLGTGPSGIDVAEIIHNKYNLPYIFLTSFSDLDTLTAAQEQGPYGYLVKPFQEKTLLTTIAIAWSNHQRLATKNELSFDKLDVNLTSKEKEICQLLFSGDSYKQICKTLIISMNTLKFHVKNIYSKLEVTGRAELTHKFLS